MLSVWDLDGTVIDSSHRHVNKPCGNIDLDHWRANSTREKIMRDRLLPLVHKMRDEERAGKLVVICTARVMTRHDREFLRVNKVPWNVIICRDEGESTPDAEMKVSKLSKLAATIGLGDCWTKVCEMWDDNDNVIAAMKAIGVKINDAKTLNYARSH